MSVKDQAMAMPDFNLSEAGIDADALAGAVRSLTGNNAEILNDLVVKLKADEKVLEAYNDVQHLQLIKLQHRLLDTGITDAKIQDAPLRDVVSAFKALKDKELVSQGKPTEIHGLVGYLVELEKEEQPEPIDITPSATSTENNAIHSSMDTEPSENAEGNLNTPTEEVVVPCL